MVFVVPVLSAQFIMLSLTVVIYLALITVNMMNWLKDVSVLMDITWIGRKIDV